MKIANLATFYPLYLQYFYAQHAALKSASFDAHQAGLCADLFGWSDFFSQHFRKLGYGATTFVINAEELQKQWAAENNCQFDSQNWVTEIAIAQLQHFAPDLIFLEDPFSLPITVKQLKEAVPSIRLVIAYVCINFDDASVFQDVDLVVTCIHRLAEQLKLRGLSTVVIAHGFETSILPHLQKTQVQKLPSSWDVSFVGSLSPKHRDRLELLQQLSNSVPLSLWSPSLVANPVELLIGVIGDHKRAEYLKFNLNWLLRRCFRGRVFGKAMYEILQQSQTTINCQIDQSGSEGGNMRLFEATGVGTCLVTDWRANLSQFFEPDAEIVVYRSTAECVEKVQWLLEHPQERDAIARAGQKRVLRDHTFAQRVLQLNDTIRKYI